ncbi:MAG TPA: DUF5060 domain-containing protein, partial [Deinococcales bacterium]|nr:DUF5060 domain-containing protein [Deinococcales bacterium]
MSRPLLALTLALALAACTQGGGNPPPGGQAENAARDLVDVLSFQAAGPPVNAANLDFSAVFSGPNGVSLTVPGYWNGGSEFGLNFNPPAAGAWAYTTRSAEPSLNGLTGLVQAAERPAGRHGALVVSKSNPRAFALQDGTAPLVLGFEAEFLPALETADPGGGKLNAMLDLIQAGGFNLVSLDAFARDTPWCPGATGCGANDYG